MACCGAMLSDENSLPPITWVLGTKQDTHKVRTSHGRTSKSFNRTTQIEMRRLAEVRWDSSQRDLLRALKGTFTGLSVTRVKAPSFNPDSKLTRFPKTRGSLRHCGPS